jgi:hypothetical protein
MNAGHSPLRRVIALLATHAQNVAPRHRADWARGMASEIHHIPGDRAAFTWALGCVFASYAERMRTMMGTPPRISRWVLVLEMLLCFVPLTWLWLAVLANLDRMQGEDGILALTAALAGPIGLAAAFKIVVLKRPLLSRFAVIGLGVFAAWTLLAYSLQVAAGGRPVHDWWREFVLIALLPALGIGHLLYLGRPGGHA